MPQVVNVIGYGPVTFPDGMSKEEMAMALRKLPPLPQARHEGRPPQASINYLTAHDGFTLRDLLSYNERNNEANGEHNRDGHAVNHSWNCGAEGPTHDHVVLETRRRLSRALLATMYFAQGVPMLQAGDELARSQHGNNNAYCQDSPTTWTDWSAAADPDLRDFVAGLAELRRRLPLLRQRRWLTGEPGVSGRQGRPDCLWWHPAGRPMSVPDWHDPEQSMVGMWLASATFGELLCLFNRAAEALEVILPEGDWTRLCDSAAEPAFTTTLQRGRLVLPGRSVVLLESA